MTLVSLAEYRAVTKDTTSTDDVATASLALAQGLAESFLGREGLLEHGTHTEVLPVWDGSIVYPTAAPLDPATDGYLTEDSLRVAVVGAPIFAGPLGGWDAYGPYLGHVQAADRVRQSVAVTYVGGFVAGALPATLKVGLARFARALLTDPTGIFGEAPPNAKSLTVGDVSVTLAIPTGSRVLPPDVALLLKPYQARSTSPT